MITLVEKVVNPITTDDFSQDVVTGLAQSPKVLSSKYFYDDRGSELFQKIMGLSEYYPTDCEFEILERYKHALLSLFSPEIFIPDSKPEHRYFDLVELGAGDGLKTKILLRHFLSCGAAFQYAPIDISQAALDGLSADLAREFPDLQVEAVCNEYGGGLERLRSESNHRRVLLFLGSSIGNFSKPEAVGFLKELRSHLSPNDLLLIGFDLVKNPRTILKAYDDSEGVTAEFNFNLLRRINRELGGNFDCDRFIHYPTYHPVTGEAKSYLISCDRQTVTLANLGVTIEFQPWEAIHMEDSKKYRLSEIEDFCYQCGFEPVHGFLDEKGYFIDALWQVP